MWVIRAEIQSSPLPVIWAYTRKGGAVGVYTLFPKNARRYKTYDNAIAAEAKLRAAQPDLLTEVSKLT